MMAGYTDTEINEAVSRYVRSGLKIERSPLGPVDANSKFTEVLALVSSTLIYDPNAIFYLIFLTSNRLNANVLTALGYVSDLLQAVNEMGKHTEDVSRTTLLGDAAAALLTVDQILTDKSALSGQAYSRYQASLDQFIKVSLRPNIKTGTDIVRPPQEARRDALTDLGLISESYAAILADTTQLMSMLSEFLGLNLPVLAIQESVRLVRYDLQQLQTFFETSSYTKNDRIAKCRSAYLAITSGRSVLDNYTTVTDPSSTRMASGSSLTGRLVVPVGAAIAPATVTSSKSGPWLLSTGSNELKIAEDGNPLTTYTIPPFSNPLVRCYTPEPYNIVASPPPPGEVANDLIELDGLTPYITLTPGAGRTATQIVADINLWASTNVQPYSASVLLEGGLNYVQIEETRSGLNRLTMTANFAAARARMLACYSTLGFYEGQSDDSVGVSAAEVANVLNAVGKVAASVDRTLFEEGLTSTYVDSTHMDLPLNSLTSIDHVDDQILIREGSSRGYHRIVSVVRLLGADRLTLASDTPLAGAAGSWLVLRERLTISSKSTGMVAQVAVLAANANTAIGLTPNSHYGQTTGFRVAKSGLDVDFTQYDVEIGDFLYLTTSTAPEAKFTVVDMNSNDQQLEFTPALPVASTITGFRIVSAAAEAYQALVVAVTAWNAAVAASKFKTDTLELDRVMNPLLTNETPSLAQIGDARTAITGTGGIEVLLTQLSTALVAYEVAAVGRIDAALKMLNERGMDRAYDMLMKGEVATFFGMDKDDAASSAFMLKSMRSLVQQDLPLSKLDDDADDDVVKSSSIGTSADLDYSDQDTDENVRILGEVPDFDNPEDEKRTRKVRY